MRLRTALTMAAAMTVVAGCGDNRDSSSQSAASGQASSAPQTSSNPRALTKLRAQSMVYRGVASAFFGGKRANYTIARNGTTVTVTDTVGDEGATVLPAVQRLYFTDLSVAFDIDETAGQVYRLYKASFDRQPDSVGLGFQIAAAEVSGVSLLQLAKNFAGSNEYQQLYGVNNTNAQFVTQLYLNALHRAPDDAGLAFHVSNLEKGIVTRESLLLGFSESAENKSQVAGDVANGITYTAYNVTAPAVVPGAPSIITATAGNGTVTLAFSSPASNGGAAISGYKGTCASGANSFSVTGTASPLVVAGLTNGTAYNCSVKAINVMGSGAASSSLAATPTTGVAPATVPGAPALGSATAGNATITLAFAAPTDNGGAAITSYTGSCSSSAGAKTATGAVSPIILSGLTNGTAYSCSVTATNSAGTGTASAALSATPTAPGPTANVPDAPKLTSAIAGSGAVTLGFDAPASNGGATITGYTATCTATVGTQSVTGTTSPIMVTGLTNGTSYSCSVKASNTAGNGASSSTLLATPVAGSTITGHLFCPYSASVANATLGLTSTVSMSCDANIRNMTANGVPDHVTGTFPNANNPSKIAAVSVRFGTSLNPSIISSTGTATPHIVGFANNGIKFDPATAESYQNAGVWNIEALGQTYVNLGADSSNAHVQPDGSYHYHGMPEGYINKLNSSPSRQMTLVGFANDGFPIYARYGYTLATSASSGLKVMTASYRMKATPSSGRPSTTQVPMGTFTQDYEYVAGLGDLDECNGRYGVTPEFPAGIYHYFITDTYPYIQRCIKGKALP